MKFTAATAIPVAVVVTLTLGLVVLLAVTRPDDAAPSAPSTATATPTNTRTLTPTRVPPTPTLTPQPTLQPAGVTPGGQPGAETLSHLSGLMLIQITARENPRGLDAAFPPDMPLEVVTALSRNEQPNRVSFFFAPPPPFASMTGSTTLGDSFGDDGGTARAAGTGLFAGEPATFEFDFTLTAERLTGTLRILAASGATILVLDWRE